ncbi:MAG TPA: FHA domain-containing protein [Candidatus Angelobacter sp.]|jgi:pSer/pThr/pTyr-binding forkhead associated (FHA) protein|nr:FHA domain-containing protein [Candidatus Angelobacter sp.]
MAKLYLKFENSVLKEITMNQAPTTIGRLPDNTVQIDNLAVSGHHARITWDKDHYEIEDLGSLNGTYVNNERVGKAKLRHCDMVKIGKHELEFKNEGPAVFSAIAAKTGPSVAKLEATVMLDTRQAQDMHAGKPFYAPAAMAAAATPAKERIGMLSVIEGKTDQEKYILTSKMNMIGKSQMASIKLKGFFAPTSAALISKRDNKYFIAPEHKVKLKINGEEVLSQRELAPGDVIEIGKMKAAFSFQD